MSQTIQQLADSVRHLTAQIPREAALPESVVKHIIHQAKSEKPVMAARPTALLRNRLDQLEARIGSAERKIIELRAIEKKLKHDLEALA